MSKSFYYENSAYTFKPQRTRDWSTNIESIIRLTQRNLSGKPRRCSQIGCERGPARYCEQCFFHGDSLRDQRLASVGEPREEMPVTSQLPKKMEEPVILESASRLQSRNDSAMPRVFASKHLLVYRHDEP